MLAIIAVVCRLWRLNVGVKPDFYTACPPLFGCLNVGVKPDFCTAFPPLFVCLNVGVKPDFYTACPPLFVCLNVGVKPDFYTACPPLFVCLNFGVKPGFYTACPPLFVCERFVLDKCFIIIVILNTKRNLSVCRIYIYIRSLWKRPISDQSRMVAADIYIYVCVCETRMTVCHSKRRSKPMKG